MMKSDVIGIHAGHAKIGSRGASALLDEVVVNRKLKKWTIYYLRKMGYNAVDCTVAVGKSSGDVLNKIKKKSIKKNTTVNVSIHLNSGGGNGVEIYLPTSSSKAKGEEFTKKLSNDFGFANRGVKGIGTFFVNTQLKNGYLIEVGFVDSKMDWSIYEFYSCKEIGKSLAQCIIKYC